MHLTVYLWCLFCLSTYNSLKTYKTLEEKRQKTKRAFSLHCTIYLVGWFWVQGGGGCSGLLWRHSVFALKLCNFSVNFFLSLAKTALSYSLFLLQYFTKYRQCFLKWLFFNSGKCSWRRRITHTATSALLSIPQSPSVGLTTVCLVPIDELRKTFSLCSSGL